MSSRPDRGSGPGRRHDETGTAIVELALVLPLVVLLLGAAFNGWNGMQQTIRLTSAARAGAIVAASDLTPTSARAAMTEDQAWTAATTAINAEEGTNVYQRGDSGANNYVSIALTPNETISGQVTINVVTITISHASVSFVPFVGSFPVTTHATARYG